jgi:hypothetical protein
LEHRQQAEKKWCIQDDARNEGKDSGKRNRKEVLEKDGLNAGGSEVGYENPEPERNLHSPPIIGPLNCV